MRIAIRVIGLIGILVSALAFLFSLTAAAVVRGCSIDADE